jgi:hypothetical protein
MEKQQRYLSYLLRMWQTSDGQQQIWRASLESPGTGQRHGFSSLEDLMIFLRAQMDRSAEGNEQSHARARHDDK